MTITVYNKQETISSTFRGARSVLELTLDLGRAAVVLELRAEHLSGPLEGVFVFPNCYV